MPSITDVPPAVVANELNAFRQHLDTLIPRKQEGENLLIATWNIRAFLLNIQPFDFVASQGRQLR